MAAGGGNTRAPGNWPPPITNEGRACAREKRKRLSETMAGARQAKAAKAQAAKAQAAQKKAQEAAGQRAGAPPLPD